MADVEGASLPDKRKRYRFLLSSFTQDERNVLSNCIEELGGVCIDTPHYIPSSTHIVCKKPNRGEKYLCGCAAGKWILKQDFIKDSHKAQRWLNEEDYEWNHQCTYNALPAGHISAPCRWRTALSLSRTGPFHGWKALILLNDPKRRNAYRSLLEVGQATVLSVKPPYQNSNLQRTSHVFVEKSLEKEAKCFADAGIPCLSPDYIPEYILQDPKPNLDEFHISNFSGCQPNNDKLKRELPSRFVTPVFPVGDKGVPKTKSRITDSLLRSAGSHKRQKSDENNPTSPKKQKQSSEEVFPPWLEWHSGNPLLNTVNASGCSPNQNNAKTCKAACVFPSHVVNAIDGYLEEDGHEIIALSVVASFLSSTRYPSAILINTIMNKLLLKASTYQLASKANTVLHRLLVLHPPPVRSTLYYQAMCSPSLSSDQQVKYSTTAWQYLSTILSQLLGLTNESEGKSLSRQTRDNCIMLVNFLYSVLERDFTSNMESKEPNLQETDKCRKTLIWKIFWPEGHGIVVNCAVRNLLKLTWKSAEKCHQDLVLRVLQGLVAMVAACFKYVDYSSMQDPYGAVIGSRMMSLATELVLTCGRTHKKEDGLRMFLQTLRPTWLKVQMLDTLVRSYNDSLVPQQNKSLLVEELSVDKIVSCYFYFLPVESTAIPDECDELNSMNIYKTPNETSRNTVLSLITDANRYHDVVEQNNNKGPDKTKKNLLNRKNIRGETPLHVAAIKNDPSKVKSLIDAGADVNLTDNAGWTPLHEACNHGHIKCVEEILKVRPLLYNPKQKQGLTGLDILSAPLCGTTPLHDAVTNNHIDVAKALVSAGGLPLLQAKTSSGETPADFAISEEMSNYLTTTEKNLINLSSQHIITSELSQGKKQLKSFSENIYLKVLGRKGCKNSKHISPEKAQEFVLMLSQLLKGCIVLSGGSMDTKELGLRMHDHVDNLKRHLEAITLGSQLTTVCLLRLEHMKFIS